MSTCPAHRTNLVVWVHERLEGLAFGCRCGLQLGHDGDHQEVAA